MPTTMMRCFFGVRPGVGAGRLWLLAGLCFLRRSESAAAAAMRRKAERDLRVKKLMCRADRTVSIGFI